jgi:hypothetical protein
MFSSAKNCPAFRNYATRSRCGMRHQQWGIIENLQHDRFIGPLAGAGRPMHGGMTPYGGRTPGGRTPALGRLPGQTPNPYTSITTPIHAGYPPPVTTGPQLAGYGMPPPQTPVWNAQTAPPAAPGVPHMNAARAAMIQQNSGWNNQGSGGGWPPR